MGIIPYTLKMKSLLFLWAMLTDYQYNGSGRTKKNDGILSPRRYFPKCYAWRARA